MENHSENKIQADICRHYNNLYCLAHHSPRCLIMSVPNGGQRGQVEAMTFKSTGLLPGASDLIVLHGRTLLWIEVKTPEGRQSTVQKEFEQRVTALGYRYHLVRSLQDFKDVIDTTPLAAK